MSRLNISGRRPGGSELMALNIDSPGEDGRFDMHNIKPVGYEGATGDGTLDLVGFDVEPELRGEESAVELRDRR